jgi:hypothetical protein
LAALSPGLGTSMPQHFFSAKTQALRSSFFEQKRAEWLILQTNSAESATR